MIELTILNYLQGALSVPCYMETPFDVPASYVRIQKTGGGRQDHIQNATLALQSIAPTLYEAAQLNEAVKAAMDSLQPGNGVFAAELNSDYEFTNTTTKQYRYQAVYDVYY